MLEYLEVKNFFMFIGCDLDRYEDAIAKGGSYDKMLEDLGSTEVDAGFEDAVTALEQVMMKMEVIDFEFPVLGLTATPDGNCWNLIKCPIAPSISLKFYSRTGRDETFNLVFEPEGLEFELRSHIFSLHVISTYRSSYSGAHITQTGGYSERSGRALVACSRGNIENW
jgi:hypothetical protein